MDSVKIIEIPQPAVFVALQRGVIDAALIGEPYLAPVRNELRTVGQPHDMIAKEFMLSVWQGNRAWVEADLQRAKRMVAAIYETARWSNSHQPETLNMLIRDAKLDPDRVKGMIRTPWATSLSPALIQPVLNFAAKYKVIDKQFDASALITQL